MSTNRPGMLADADLASVAAAFCAELSGEARSALKDARHAAQRRTAVSAVLRLDNAFTFHDGVNAIDSKDGDFLFEAAGPLDFKLVDFSSGAEAEVSALVGA